MNLIHLKNRLAYANKAVCSIVLFALLFTQLLSAPVLAAVIPRADPPIEPEVVKDLVVIVVDKGLDRNTTSYQGLRNDYINELANFTAEINGSNITLSGLTLSERIMRYAEDLRMSNNLTDVRILFYDKDHESVNDLALALENLYLNENLVGAVFVGDIPMPVVNKNGNQFMSLFPYTDFLDKTYVYDPVMKTFSPNPNNIYPKPEIWHGIINAPADELAVYFDKNHLYYLGVPEFADFGKRLFIADLKGEEEGMNADMFSKYNDYLDKAEDLTYMRFNKFWADSLTSETVGDLSFNEDYSDDYTSGSDYKQTLENLDLTENMPDIYTKDIIEKHYPSYYEVFGNFISKLNDLVDGTGRYSVADYDSLPILITVKDEYNRYYLKAVNDAIERKVNEVVEQIQEPLPLLKKTQLTGKFSDATGTTFGVAVSSPFGTIPPPSLPLGWKMEDIYLRYHYYNEYLDELYVNGVAAKDMTNAKQCSIFLGSTRENLDGDYSVLVTANRSDDLKTSSRTPTAGVTTRTLTSKEAFDLTNGAVSNGAVVEGNDYGMPAFILNDLFGTGDAYMSPLQKDLQEGDVITKVNGVDINAQNPFDLAIANSYEWVKSIMDISNGSDYTDEERLEILNNFPYEVRMPPGDSINGGNAVIGAGVMEVEFYRGGQRFVKNYTFSVHKDGYASVADPEGNPEIVVVMSPSLSAGAFSSQTDFDGGGHWSDGAIFSLYNTGKRGFANEGYDASAGCNANSTQYYDATAGAPVYTKDRCYGTLAALPVMDPAGGKNVRTVSEPTHPYLYQIPAGTSFEDIDEVIYDACYFGMPAVKSLNADGNPYPFALDPSNKDILDYAIDQDFYGDFVDRAAEFIDSDDGSKPKKSPSRSDDWKNLDTLDASDVVLNNYLFSDKVTLKDFSDHYGLFDGIDNDGDGIRDYYWTDTNNDGIYDTKVYDSEEAGAAYALDPTNLADIARKMLSHNSTYILPASLSPFNVDLTLTVAVDQEKQISSMILHNEPTPYTITEQLKSMAAMDLPIDNPRYVAFMSEPVPLPTYPGVNEEPYYFPGSVEKIYYPNLFDYSNYAELEVALDQLAWDIVMIPGSYRINGSSYTDCMVPADNFANCKELHDVIMNDYLDPVVGFSGETDSPDDFTIDEASVKKVYDALDWQNLNIDQKHEYVLTKYLNDGENAFVGDKTLFPAPPGYTIGSGYEAAFLVLNGNGDNFDMKFNKDFPQDDDENFDPLQTVQTQEEYDAEAQAGTLEEDEKDKFEFVRLDQFLKETKDFITSFSSKPEFKDCCAYSAEQKDAREAEESGAEEPATDTVSYTSALLSDQPLDHLVLNVDKETVNAGSTDNLHVQVRGYDANDSLIGPMFTNPLISLKILQNEDAPLVSNSGYGKKAFVNGIADFELSTTGEVGNIVIYAQSSDGIVSNSVPVKITNRDIRFSSYVFVSLPEQPDQSEQGNQTAQDAQENQVTRENPSSTQEAAGAQTNNESAESVGGGTGEGYTEGSSTLSEQPSSDQQPTTPEQKTVARQQSGSMFEKKLPDLLAQEESSAKKSAPSASETTGEMTDTAGASGEAAGPGTTGEKTVDENSPLANESPNIVVLSSEPVSPEESEQATEAESVSDGQGTKPAPVSEEQVAEPDISIEQATEPSTETQTSTSWEDYYIDTDYYKRFEAYERSRLFARLLSDLPQDIPDPTDENSPYITEASDQMIADGESLMGVNVALYDDSGALVADENKVRFSIVDSDVPDIVTFVNGDTSLTRGGEATVYLRAGTVAGTFKIRAEVLNSDGTVNTQYPLSEKQLYLVAGDPACLTIETDSCTIPPVDNPCDLPEQLPACVMVANNEFKSNLEVSVYDKFGNLANNSFSQIALFADDSLLIDPSADTNTQILGTQTGSIEGRTFVDIFAKDQPSQANVAAVLLDYDLENEFIDKGDNWNEIDFSKYVGATRSFDLLENADLDVSLNKSSIKVGGEVVQIETKLMSDGSVVDNYSGPIKFSVLNENVGAFVQAPPSKMVDGVLVGNNVKFKSSNMSGFAEILVEIPGAVSKVVKFKVLPDSPERIELTSNAEKIYSDGAQEVVLEAKLLDKYGNLVNSDAGSGVVVNFGLTPTTQGFLDFVTAQSAVSLNGVASVRVKGGDISGIANIIAASAQIGSPATLSLEVVKHFGPDMVKDFAPRALYLSLLGGDFGKLTPERNMSEILLYGDGQIQAVGSLSSSVDGHKRLFGIDAYGKLDLVSDSTVTKIVPATDSFPYQKIIISDAVSDEELATVFMVPDPDSQLVLLENDDEISDPAIYVKNVSTADPDIEFNQRDDGIYMIKNGETKAKIDKFGRISLNDDSFELDILDDRANLTFVIKNRIENLAEISFVQDFGKDVQYKSYNDPLSALFPGVYMQVNTVSGRYKTSLKFSGNSTANPLGYYLLDIENKIDSAQAPYLNENAKDLLFFSAGNSVGESHLPYGSEVTVIYGDPNIRLKNEGIVGLISSLTGYTKTIGQSLLASDEEIVDMISFEYNGDGLKDLLLIYADGRIRLLEHEISNRNFKDMGYVLNAFSGATSAVAIDVNNDGYDDLVLGTEESCTENDKPVSLFINKNGHFERESKNFDIQGEINEMKSADMNNDGCGDLVVSDSAGNVRIFYNTNDGNTCTGLETDFGYGKNFGYEVDSTENLVSDLFVYYPGMPSPTGEELNFVLSDDTPPTSAETGAVYAQEVNDLYDAIGNGDYIAQADLPPLSYQKEYTLIPIFDDAVFAQTSSKQAVDANGGTISDGDRINYLITLKNSGSAAVTDMILSDFIPPNMTLEPDSLQCLDNGCADELAWEETGVSSRPRVIKNISVPAGGSRTIMYSAILNSTPKINFNLGDFDSTNFPDILVRPSYNPDGSLTYLYSKSNLSVAGYNDYTVSQVASTGYDRTGDLPIDVGELSSVDPQNPKIPPDLKQKMNSMTYPYDSDGDGCPDSWAGGLSEAQSAAESVANTVSSAIKTLRCSGGCLPIPYNYAFFAADDAVPGLPIFSLGHTWPGGMGSFLPTTSFPSTFRFYLSPTLTMGLGSAVCTGPSSGHQSPCFAFSIPLTQALGVCDAIQGPINDAIATATNSLSNPDIGLATVVSDGSGGAGTGTTSGNFAYSNKSSPVNAAGAYNIKIPGFPSVITNWLDKQTDEIYNKLLDFPTFYFLYPDFKTMIPDSATFNANFSKIKNHYDFLKVINSIPLVQVEGKEVLIKIPAISQSEITKWKRQADAWLKYEESEIKRFTDHYSCDTETDPTRKSLCDKFVMNMKDLTIAVKQLMTKVDRISNLPRDVLNWKTLESKYASQIICWLNAIMEFTGGYVERQSKIVKSWIKASEDAVKTFKGWKTVLDLSAEYQKSCDQCKNDRFSKLNILMQLFAAIPEPPIIPLPKWPDVVVDFSQLKTGIKVIWPDLKFQPQSVRLPNLPYFTFPTDFTPNLIYELPSFEIPTWMKNFPDFVMPDLPDLPPLQIPKLPDLPRPPKIPKLPQPVVKLASNLKVIFKILCLLKKGFIPIPEAKLATEIETLTQSSVKAALPIIGKLGIQIPPVKYDFVEQIRITLKLDIGLDLTTIYLVTKAGADFMNNGVKNMINSINDFLKFDLQTPINNAVKAAENSLKTGVEAGVERNTNNNEVSYNEVSQTEQLLFDNINHQFDEINTVLDDYISTLDKQNLPDTYYVTATPEYLDPSSPFLNRSIDEIERDIANQDLPDTPEIQRLAMIRDSLIAYTKNLNSTNDALSKTLDDYDEFTRILVDKSDSYGGEDISRLLSSINIPTNEDPPIKEVSFDLFHGDLIAADLDPVSEVVDSLDGGETAPAQRGFFVVANGQSESVLSYVDELDKTVHTLFSDVDGDEDFDIIYSMGGDVYLKENYTSQNPLSSYLSKGDIILSNTNASVSDFVPSGGAAVQGLVSPYENNNRADLNWAAVPDAVSYEILIKRSLLHSDEDAMLTYTVDAPETSLALDALENGNYYAVIYAINSAGEKSLVSNTSLVSPQICADKDAPFPALTRDSYDLSILKDLEIDASGSFDTSGEVTEFYLEGGGNVYWSDLNTAIDSDGDGIVWNDRNNPKFKIGPFSDKNDVGLLQFILYVADQSGHTSTQNMDVNVFVPKITLDETVSRSKVATGKVIPDVDSLPFSLLRSRYIYRSVDDKLSAFPRVEKIETQSASATGKYFTQGDGTYEISDFDLEDMILVENSSGETVAEIHPKTGNVGALSDTYDAVVNEALPPNSPTSITVEDGNGDALAYVYLIADPNEDVNILENTFFDAENFDSYSGVNVSDINTDDEFYFEPISAQDPYYPGGAALMHKGEDKHLLFVDPSGNILVVDDRITLDLKENDHTKDPLVIDVLFEGEKAAEIYISVLYENMLIVGPNDVPYLTPRAPSSSIFYSYGERASLAPEFVPEELVKRKEFVKVLLDMLCIIPRPESYEAYKGTEGESGGGFYDLVWNPDQLPEYYEYIKEADLLGLVYGYTGETDPVTGLHPFKPDNTITRAEATNIILEALEFEGVLNLDSLSIGSPWYVPIIEAGQDMTPYINPGYNLKNNFIITPEEAAEPNKEMTHEDLTIMVERVLELYSCYELDADLDGMSDFCEEKYGIDDPYADEDNDEMLNTNECFYHTDPTNPDTDGGGMIDGKEMKYNTNPLNPDDDPVDSDGDGCTDLAEILVYSTDPNDPDTDNGGVDDCTEVTDNLTDPLNTDDDYEKGDFSEAEPGLYIVPANCNSCPCVSTLLNKADLIPGDILFTVISTDNEDYIFSKSNEVTIN